MADTPPETIDGEIVENGDHRLVVIPEGPVAAADPYEGIAIAPFAPEIAEKLLAPIPVEDIEIRPNDGFIYWPQTRLRKRMNHTFGPGGWALQPREIKVGDEHRTQKGGISVTVFYRGALYALGRFVAESIGEAKYNKDNPKQSYATAAEAAKSDCLTRCAKDLGIAGELWDPTFADAWVRENAYKGNDGKWYKRGGGAQVPAQATTRRPAAPAHPFAAGDRPSFTFKTIEPKDKWRERPQGRKAKWFSVELADGTIVWCFTESNPESAEAKKQWAMKDEGTFLVDDTDFKDGTPCAKVSEVRRKPKAKPGGALLDAVMAYKELLLMRDWLSGCQKVLGADAGGKVTEPDEDTPAAKLVELQGLFEPLHQAAEGGAEDARNGAETPDDEPRGLPDDDPGSTEDVPF